MNTRRWVIQYVFKRDGRIRQLYLWWSGSLPERKRILMRGVRIVESALDTWTPEALFVLRSMAAYLYMKRGTANLLPVPRIPLFDSLRLLPRGGHAGMLEIVGLLTLLGLCTRPVAFIVSGDAAIDIL